MARNEGGDDVFVNDFADGNQESGFDTGARRIESFQQDTNSVFYLHHSDHPNYTLSTQLLNDRNYYHWKRSVEVSLRAKNKIDFVNRKCVKPDSDSPMLAQWERCNNMVMSWLIHSVEKDIGETLLYYDSAADVWDDLRMRFGSPNCTRVFQVQKELFTVSQGSQSITTYYTKFKKLWNEYMVLVEMPSCSHCGSVASVPQFLYDLQVIQFLVGLNDAYSLARANILMMKPMPNLVEVYHMVLQDEKQKELRSSAVIGGDSSALNVQRSGSGRGSYNSSGNSGRGGYSGQSRGGRTSSNVGTQDRRLMYYCEHCKTHGHTIDRCFKVHGYPEQRNDRQQYQPREQRGRANSVTGNGEIQQAGISSNGSMDSAEKGPLLTQDQVNQLLALLGKSEVSSPGSYKSGPFHEQCNGSW